MSNRRKMTMVLEAVDKYSKQFKGAAEASKGFAKVAQKLNKEQRTLNRKLADVSSYQRLQKEISESNYQMKIAARRSVQLAGKLSKTKAPTSQLKAEFRSAQKAEDRLNREHLKQVKNLNRLQKELQEAKVDTNDLSGATKKLQREQSNLARRTKLAKLADRTKSGVGKAASKARGFATKGALIGGGPWFPL